MMALLDVVGQLVDLYESPMESLVVDLVDDARHPCAVVFIPALAFLKVVQEGIMCFVEILVVAAHLRLLKTLYELLLLFSRTLLGAERHAREQQGDGHDDILVIHIYRVLINSVGVCCVVQNYKKNSFEATNETQKAQIL